MNTVSLKENILNTIQYGVELKGSNSLKYNGLDVKLRPNTLKIKNNIIESLFKFNSCKSDFVKIITNNLLFDEINTFNDRYVYKNLNISLFNYDMIVDIKDFIKDGSKFSQEHQDDLFKYFHDYPTAYSSGSGALKVYFAGILYNLVGEENMFTPIRSYRTSYDYESYSNIFEFINYLLRDSRSYFRIDSIQESQVEKEMKDKAVLIKQICKKVSFIANGYNEVSPVNLSMEMTDEEFVEFERFCHFFYSVKTNLSIFEETRRSFCNLNDSLKNRIYENTEKANYIKTLFRYYFHCNAEISEKATIQLIDFIEKADIETLEKIIDECKIESFYIYKYIFRNNEALSKTIEKTCKSSRFDDKELKKFFNFVNYAYDNKKKNALKMLSELILEQNKVYYNIKNIFCKEALVYMDINSACTKELQDIENISFSSNFLTFLKDNISLPCSINEFKTLDKASEFQRNVYKHLDGKIDNKLLQIRSLPNVEMKSFIQTVFDGQVYNRNYENFYDISCKKIASALSTYGSFDKMKKKLKKIKELTDVQIINFYLNEENLTSLLNNNLFTFGYDIVFAINNLEFIKEDMSAEEFNNLRRISIYKDSEFRDFADKANISNDFVLKNIDRIFDFINSGLFVIINKMYKSHVYDLKQKRNLLLITKACLTNKFKELKYDSADFEKEIGFNVDFKKQELWKENISLSELGIDIIEKDDFDTTIRLGQYPVRTCQHWDGNMSQSRSLLSMFDTNKKIITVHKNGKYISRAILRFTKYSKEAIKSDNGDLTFKDFDENGNVIIHNDNTSINKTVRPCLFLELPYSADSNHAIYQGIIDLAKEKARKMGIDLLVNNRYSYADLSNFEKMGTTYIYISKSKNGYQYLDSVNGEASEQKEGSYLPAYNIHMLNIENNK